MENEYMLSIWDGGAFCLVLLISLLIGVFFGTFKKAENNREFLLGSKDMALLPSVFSMVISFVSSISLLTYPAEVYVYGMAFAWHTVGGVLAMVFVAVFIVPVVYNVKSESVYRYFIERFESKSLTLYCSVQFCMSAFFYASVTLYTPAISLAAVTNFPLWLLIILIGLLCTAYTTLGGIKAVIWTDALQMTVLFIGCIAVWIKGSIATGGLDWAWQVAAQGKRLDGFTDFNPDPYRRMSAVTAVFGGLFYWMTAFGGSQVALQRYCCMSTVKRAQAIMWWTIPCFVAVQILCFGMGVLLYAFYVNCDPLQLGVVRTGDQLVIHFVAQLFHKVPGLSGIFVAAILSGSLSTLSSVINSMSAVTWNEFIGPCFLQKQLSPSTVTLFTKLIGLVYGLGATGMAFSAEPLGGILNALVSGLGALNGPKLGLFLLGIFVPWANGMGSLIAVTIGTVVAMWMFVGGRFYPARATKLPLSVDFCNVSSNLAANSSLLSNSSFATEGLEFVSAKFTNITVDSPSEDSALINFYSISFFYLAAIGCILTFLLGILFSPLYDFLLKKKQASRTVHEINKGKACEKTYETGL